VPLSRVQRNYGQKIICDIRVLRYHTKSLIGKKRIMMEIFVTKPILKINMFYDQKYYQYLRNLKGQQLKRDSTLFVGAPFN